MAKYQDTVEILIQARDEARRELQGIRGEVAKTRKEIGGQAGIVAGAAKLHHALQKVSAVTDGIKTGMAGLRGIIKGADGDTEGMVESFKQLGFGIGEVVTQADMLFETLGNKLYGVTEEMLELEKKRAAEHGKSVKLQQQQNAEAAKSRSTLFETVRMQSVELRMLNARSDEDKERLAANQRLIEVQKKVSELRAAAEKDISKQERDRGNALADQVLINADLIEQAKEKARQEKAAADEMERQKKAAEQVRASRRDTVNTAIKSFRKMVVDELRGQLDEVRDQIGSIAQRGSTISLGSQSGRFVSGLRDRQAQREDPIVAEQRKLKESLEREAEKLRQQLDTLNKKIGGDNVKLIPMTIGGGRVF